MDEEKTPDRSAAKSPPLGEAAAREAQDFWDETKSRGKRAGERISQEWDRVSTQAGGYAREHSLEVAGAALAVGFFAGLLVGLLLGRD